MYKILLATDGSEYASRAVEQTLFFAGGLSDVQVTIIHVSTTVPPRSKLLEANFNVMSVLEDQTHEALKETEALAKEYCMKRSVQY